MNEDVKKYIEKHKSPQKEILKKIRIVIQNSAPLANETMSYGVPAFKINGHLLVAYAAFKQHIGLYPEPDTIQSFEKELKSYKTSKGTIQFRLDQPIPYDVIEKIIKYKYNKLSEK
jgi:uncharacterized protein YdhG (YjbR/CyaY superfamily)